MMSTRSSPSGTASGLVADVMRTDVVSVKPQDTMLQAAAVFHKNKILAAPVVDDMDHCIGVLTATDFIDYLADKQQFASEELDISVDRNETGKVRVGVESFELVNRHMTTTIQTIDHHASLDTARQMMAESKIHHLFVLATGGRVSGIVSSLDVL